MFWSSVWTVFAKEVRDSLRDRRAVVSMFVVPTLVMPALMLVAGVVGAKVVRKATAERGPIEVIGGADAPGVVAALRESPRLEIVELPGDFRQLIADKRIRVAVEIPPNFATTLAAEGEAGVTIYHYEGELRSRIARDEVDRCLREYRERTVRARLDARGLPAGLTRPFEIVQENAAPPEKVGGNLFGGFIPYVIVVLCFTGAMYPAIDLTAGEKERGTIETLLCSPVDRTALVTGKFLTVLAASVATICSTMLSMGVCLLVAGSLLVGSGAAGQAGPGALPLSLDPLGMLGVCVLVLPVAVLFSAVLLAVSLLARSHKEAQTYVSPMVIVIVLPAMIGMLPGVELDAKLACVPILNVALACKEMLSGVWHWGYLALIFGSTGAYAGAAMAAAVAMFKRESVLFRT